MGIRHHEVAIQRGAPLREEEGRGGEDQEEVPRQSPRHRGEESQGQDRRPGQEEVPRSLRSHRRPVLLPHPKEDQPPWAHCTRNTTKKISSSTLPTQTSLFMETKVNEFLHQYLDSSTQKIF